MNVTSEKTQTLLCVVIVSATHDCHYHLKWTCSFQLDQGTVVDRGYNIIYKVSYYFHVGSFITQIDNLTNKMKIGANLLTI